MEIHEKDSFFFALKNLTDYFRVAELIPIVKEQYWVDLRIFSSAQFINACTRLRTGYKKRFSNDFPMSSDFIDAMAPIPAEYKHQSAFVPHQVVIPNGMVAKLISMMPPEGTYYNDEQAREMVRQMDLEVNKYVQQTTLFE